MKKQVRQALICITLWLLLSSLIALVVAELFQIKFWICFVISGAAMILNGLFAEWEDRRPGGFLDLVIKTNSPEIQIPTY